METSSFLEILVAAAVVGLAGATVTGCTLGTGPSTLEADSAKDDSGSRVGSLAPDHDLRSLPMPAPAGDGHLVVEPRGGETPAV